MNRYVEFHFTAYHIYWEIAFFEEILSHLIVNRYVEFHFTAYHNYWEITFFEEILSHLIVNRYVEFHFTAYHNYWEIAFFWRNSKSKKGNNSNKILDGVVFSCQQIGVNTFYKCIEFEVNSFNSYWEILIILKKYPKFLCTMSKQGQITLDIHITGSPALL